MTPAAPTPVPPPEPLAAIRAALARLDGIEALPVAEHVVRFAALQDGLAEALAAVDGS